MASVRVDGQFLAIILPEPDTIKLMMPIFSIRNLVVLVCDLATVVLAVYLAFVLRLQDLAIVGHQENAVKTLGLAIGLYAFSVYQVGLLRGLWRYMSSYDVYRLLGAVTIITLGLVVADLRNAWWLRIVDNCCARPTNNKRIPHGVRPSRWPVSSHHFARAGYYQTHDADFQHS